MKYLFLILIFSFLQVFAIAQTSLAPSEIAKEVKYIYLHKDSLIIGTELYREQFNGQDYIYLDGKTYKTQTVKFFKNEFGLFANTTKFYTSGLFAEAIEVGKLNLFELNHTLAIPIRNEFGDFQEVPKNSTYYNIGFGDLKRTTYANLILDLADTPTAMLHLKKYNAVRRNQNILYVLSGIFGVAAIASFSSDSESALALGIGSALVAATTTTIAISIGLKKKSHLQKAIQAYNF